MSVEFSDIQKKVINLALKAFMPKKSKEKEFNYIQEKVINKTFATLREKQLSWEKEHSRLSEKQEALLGKKLPGWSGENNLSNLRSILSTKASLKKHCNLTEDEFLVFQDVLINSFDDLTDFILPRSGNQNEIFYMDSAALTAFGVLKLENAPLYTSFDKDLANIYEGEKMSANSTEIAILKKALASINQTRDAVIKKGSGPDQCNYLLESYLKDGRYDLGLSFSEELILAEILGDDEKYRSAYHALTAEIVYEALMAEMASEDIQARELYDDALIKKSKLEQSMTDLEMLKPKLEKQREQHLLEKQLEQQLLKKQLAQHLLGKQLEEHYEALIREYIDHVKNANYSSDKKEAKLAIAYQALANLTGEDCRYSVYPDDDKVHKDDIMYITYSATKNENVSKRLAAFENTITKEKEVLTKDLNLAGLTLIGRLFKYIKESLKTRSENQEPKAKLLSTGGGFLEFFKAKSHGQALVEAVIPEAVIPKTPSKSRTH